MPAGEAPEPTPLPPFIEQLMALAKASRPDHPARGIPVIDALYEDPPVEAAPVMFPSFVRFFRMYIDMSGVSMLGMNGRV